MSVIHLFQNQSEYTNIVMRSQSHSYQGLRTNALCLNLLSRSTIVLFKNLFLTNRSEFVVFFLR